MHVLRGRAGTPDADRAATDALKRRVADTGEPGVRVWYPPAHVAFGRRDAATEGYDRAQEVASERGFPAVERAVGGRAVAFTGDVLAFVRAEPTSADRPAVDSRYDAALTDLENALADCGVAVSRGEPTDSFCPGSHSLQTAASARADSAGKIAGLAQRVRRDVATVAGLVVVRDGTAVADVLAPVYDALDVPFDPESVGSVAAGRTDGTPDPAAITAAVEGALVGDRPVTTHSVRDT